MGEQGAGRSCRTAVLGWLGRAGEARGSGELAGRGGCGSSCSHRPVQLGLFDVGGMQATWLWLKVLAIKAL